jgi:alpha-galactosidase-like CBM13-containing protein/fibronectin type III domain protein
VKKQINLPGKAHVLWRAIPLIGLIVFGGVAVRLAAIGSTTNLPEQTTISPASLQPSAATHETRAGLEAGLQKIIEFGNAKEITPPVETVSSAPPTRSSFMATWDSVGGAKGYLLDVSTSDSFSSYVDGYHGLDVGNINGRAVTGLKPGTTYYYRVRPYTAASSGEYSNVSTATTEAAAGLIIMPEFDCSIGNDLTIRAMIMRAIAIYESLFSDPITIHILFRYSDTGPGGPCPSATPGPSATPSPSANPSATPFPPGVLSQSFFVPYDILWNQFISALRADATTSNDNTANASLPGSAFSNSIVVSSANGRALGLNTQPAMRSDGTIGPGGTFDGIVTLNSAQPFSFTRPLISRSFDAQRAVEHEIDEVIGLGSYLNSVRTCPSYEAESPICPQPSGEECSIITGGAGIQNCSTCSGGADVGYVGNNSGTLQFNGVTANTTHSYVVTIWYTNGDATRYALLSVNGSAGTPLSFPSTGSFQTLGSIQTNVTLNAGSDNTLEFYNPIVGNFAPDFDRIVVNCGVPPAANLRPQDLFSWRSPGNRNLTSNGSRYFSIDSGSTNIVGFNQTPPGDFGDWLSAPCPQRHPFVQNAFACRDQFSDISATSPEGINLDVIGYDLVTTPYLANLSTRAFVQTSDNVMIGGFIVQGTQPKRVIIRAIGPELSQYGVPNAMADPILELHNGTGAPIASNNNWQTTIIGGIITSDQVPDIQNSGHAPGDERESAIIADLPPGNYTAIVRGVNNTMGVALVEVYDLSPSLQSILDNISTRSLVQTGNNVMIGGFIVQGAQPKNVIIRAIGPELSQYGVPNPLANPTLELHNGAGTLIASNNDWQQTIVGGIITSNQVQSIQNSGHAPMDPNESAIIANLPPGNYTAIVRGVNNTTGVALVEVYDLR